MKKYLKDIPDIFVELHPTKNDLFACRNLTRASGRKVWWLCSEGHEYEARVDHRTISGSGCPYCSGRYATPENNLQIKYPEIAASICVERSGQIDASKIAPNSHQKLWWQCLKDQRHVWEARVYSRVKNEESCPYCSGYKVDETNSLLSLFPEICSEWDFEKNAPLTPDKITSGTRRKVWWICQHGHSFNSSIVQRTKKKSGCPFCSNKSSKPELRILTELMTIFDDIKHRHRVGKTEIDVFIPHIKVGIEFDGSYFHKANEENDTKKGEILFKKGIHLVRVRVKPLKKINKWDLIVEKDELEKSDINNLLESIKPRTCNIEASKIDEYSKAINFSNEELFQTYLSYFPSPLPEHSLQVRFPKIASEWHYEKNRPLSPKNFTAFSNHIVWWICPKGHEYDMLINSRTGQGINCPYCAGKRVDESNSLASIHPELAKQFHKQKNHPLTAHDIPIGSGKNVWWTCENGHDFESVVAGRVSRKRGCPYCSGRKASTTNNLKTLHPWIDEILDTEKNSDLKPEALPPKSKIKVWLKCDKGHSYEKKAKNIKPKENCPFCLKIKPSAEYNLSVLYPQTSERFCREKNKTEPDQILPASGQKVWWECLSGHQYQRRVYSEVKNGKCPICKK
jgi:very-short-patch-repair endonuclease